MTDEKKSIGEQLDRLVIQSLKNVRLGEGDEVREWDKVQCACRELVGELDGVAKTPAVICGCANLLLAINKAIWDRDTHLRKAEINLWDDAIMAKVGGLAVGAHDFNYIRILVIELIRVICAEGGEPDANVDSSRLAKG